jgi:hypothetical protein
MTGITLTIHFPTEKDRDIFLDWLSDGGGEQEFMEYTDTTVTSFDYSYAFPAWGYDPKVHGEPVVILQSE